MVPVANNASSVSSNVTQDRRQDDPLDTLLTKSLDDARPLGRGAQSHINFDATSPGALWRTAEATPEQKSDLWYLNKRLAQLENIVGETVLTSRPVWIMFDTGSVCNLRCVQCPRENPNRKFIEHKTDQKIAERILAASSALQRLSLYGLGEPLLSDVFWNVIEDNRSKKIPNIDINTNGTLLSENNVDRLLKSSLKFLRISVDGATPTTYRRIRGGNLTKIIEGVRRLTKRRHELGRADFQVWLSMTLMLENIRELPMMIDLGCEVGADALWAQHLVMRSDERHENWNLTHDGWTFVYTEQHLSNAPALSNKMVQLASKKAVQRGFKFVIDPDLWFQE